MIKDTLLETGLFIDNEYLNEYINLIEDNIGTHVQYKRTQRHHIIPKFYYKNKGIKIDNSANNCINLLYKEHIYAHYLMCKCSSTDEILFFNIRAIQYLLGKSDISNFDFTDDVLKEYQALYEKSRETFYEKTHSIESSIKIQEKLTGRRSPNFGNAKKEKKIKKSTHCGKPCSEKVKKKLSEVNGYKVRMFDYYTKQPIRDFTSAMEASNYLIQIGKTKNKSANHRILSVCELNDLKYHAYGYCWKFIK